jgi:hypothetical protein
MATIKTVSKLSGKYFNFADVTNFIVSQGKFSLASILQNACNREKFNGIEYVTKSEAQTFIIPSIFRQMECEVTTIMTL